MWPFAKIGSETVLTLWLCIGQLSIRSDILPARIEARLGMPQPVFEPRLGPSAPPIFYDTKIDRVSTALLKL